MIRVKSILCLYAIAASVIVLFFLHRGKLDWNVLSTISSSSPLNESFYHYIPVQILSQPPVDVSSGRVEEVKHHSRTDLSLLHSTTSNPSHTIWILNSSHKTNITTSHVVNSKYVHNDFVELKASVESQRFNSTSSDTLIYPRAPHERHHYNSTMINSTAAINSRTVDKNVFLHYINKIIKSDADIVLFVGHGIQKLYGVPGEKRSADIVLNGKSKLRFWGDIISMGDKISRAKNGTAAVHIHNEHKLGDLFEMIELQFKKELRAHGVKAFKQRRMTREEIIATMDRGERPVVITNGVDENWGFFSTREFAVVIVNPHETAFTGACVA